MNTKTLQLTYEKAEEKAAQAHSTAVHMCNERAWNVAARAAKVAEQAHRAWMESKEATKKMVKMYKSGKVTIGNRVYHPGLASLVRLMYCHHATNPKQRGVNAGEIGTWFRWNGNRDWMKPECTKS